MLHWAIVEADSQRYQLLIGQSATVPDGAPVIGRSPAGSDGLP